MRFIRIRTFFVLGLLLSTSISAKARICNPLNENCAITGRSRSSPTQPSQSSGFNLNPSAVPVEKGLGAEMIIYGSAPDFALVSGTGRVGAGLSPTNGEESLFGPPGFEDDDDYLQRKIQQNKYVSQKISLATAVQIFDNKKRGLKRFDVNLGAIGKYNRLSGHVHPGGGLNGVAGPFTFGYAYSNDEYAIDFRELGYNPTGGDLIQSFPYTVETTSVGIFLSNVALDSSYLKIKVEGDENDPVTIRLLTGTVFVKKLILTASFRTEDSSRPAFDFDTKSLVERRVKRERFFGLQVHGAKNVLFGCFYNYYLLREISLGLTVFF